MTKFFLLSMPISFRWARNAAVRSRTPLSSRAEVEKVQLSYMVLIW
ncbi:unnamed protein product [Musa banksii]